MLEQPKYLYYMLNCCELIAAIVALMYFKNFKNSYWKWFAYYLFYIVFYDVIIGRLALGFYLSSKLDAYFAFVQIPIEFLFFIWLFALKSLNNKKLFWVCISVYLLSLIPDSSLSKGDYYFSSFNYIIGALLLLVLVILEFNKQIKSETILQFKEDKMFYINIGVVLFYIGTLPFFGLYYPIMKVPEIWNNYYIYFMISNCIMYLLFASSFIWGKVKL